jgi:hypothetical protein
MEGRTTKSTAEEGGASDHLGLKRGLEVDELRGGRSGAHLLWLLLRRGGLTPSEDLSIDGIEELHAECERLIRCILRDLNPTLRVRRVSELVLRCVPAVNRTNTYTTEMSAGCIQSSRVTSQRFLRPRALAVHVFRLT